MTRKGICHKCGQQRWLGGKGGCCKPCTYSFGSCINCKKHAKLFVEALCYICYEDRQVRVSLQDIESTATFDRDYDRYLFDLYLKYIRRYQLKYFHLKQAKKLLFFLQISANYKVNLTILSWLDVYALSAKVQIFHKPNSKKGCAIHKIGYMLQELGVLPSRSLELGRQIQNKINSFDHGSFILLESFIKILKQTNRAMTTVVDYLTLLKHLETWLQLNHNTTSLQCVNQEMLVAFLDSLKSNQNPKYNRKTASHLNYFYRWCVKEKLILKNPCEGILLSREASRVHVCSEEQYRKIFAYIKNPLSSSQASFILALIIFYGLTVEDLAFATIDPTAGQNILKIVLHRKSRTKGRHFYNRDQTLTLPTSPVWFDKLQKRFYNDWLLHYAKTKTTYPRYSLILPNHYRHNRPISRECIRKRIRQATKKASGIAIPSRVLRQTCGHIHSQSGDASALTKLGWSPQFAFHYTWLPRTYFQNPTI